jgi:predicted metal-dependent enzyme (double-stranded beta helix superfamily)
LIIARPFALKETNVFDLDRFIEECRAALADPTPARAMKEVVARAVSAPAEVDRALENQRRDGVNRIYAGPDLTILNVVWPPAMSIYPHDHRMWAVIGVYAGQEDNAFYRRAPAGLQRAGGKSLALRDTVVLGKDAIHSVINPLATYTGAIHIYGGDFLNQPRSEWDPASLEERPYNTENVRRAFEEARRRAAPA